MIQPCISRLVVFNHTITWEAICGLSSRMPMSHCSRLFRLAGREAISPLTLAISCGIRIARRPLTTANKTTRLTTVAAALPAILTRFSSFM